MRNLTDIQIEKLSVVYGINNASKEKALEIIDFELSKDAVWVYNDRGRELSKKDMDELCIIYPYEEGVN